MDSNTIKYELQNIIHGKSENSPRTLIETITNHLRTSQRTSSLVEKNKQYKQEETEKLIAYCNANNLWTLDKINLNLYISEGAEQKVYIKNDTTVYKLNDSIYYSTWQDYFTNLLLNNYFFPDTAYALIGFCLIENVLYALVEQAFVTANEPTNLKQVKEFMNTNGFLNTRNHDYYNPDLGIILEDLHDENVLTKDGILYFIDTVFYLKDE
jgi:Serine/Threonine/Tyrosine Kinase found in polyvalent proteins